MSRANSIESSWGDEGCYLVRARLLVCSKHGWSWISKCFLSWAITQSAPFTQKSIYRVSNRAVWTIVLYPQDGWPYPTLLLHRHPSSVSLEVTAIGQLLSQAEVMMVCDEFITCFVLEERVWFDTTTNTNTQNKRWRDEKTLNDKHYIRLFSECNIFKCYILSEIKLNIKHFFTYFTMFLFSFSLTWFTKKLELE